MDISLLKEKSLMDLREIAKMAGIKSVTKYRKSELLDMLYELDRQARSGEMAQQQAEEPVEAPAEAMDEPMEEPAEEPVAEEEGNIPSYQQDVLVRRQRRERPRDNDMAREPRERRREEDH